MRTDDAYLLIGTLRAGIFPSPGGEEILSLLA